MFSSRLPAGSRVVRRSRPAVTKYDVDDLADMFSSTRASDDPLTLQMDALSMFGKSRFGKKYGKNMFGG